MAVAERTLRELRVLHCLDSLAIGGTELNALKVIQATSAAATHFLASYHGGALQQQFEEYCGPVSLLPTNRPVGVHHVQAARQLRRLVASHRINVVHCHDMYSNVLGWLLGWHYLRPLTVASLRWDPARQPRRTRLANSMVYPLFDRVVTNAESSRKYLVRQGIRADKVVYIPNMLEPLVLRGGPPDAAEQRRLRAELGLADEAIVVGMVANFNHHKDQQALIQAAGALVQAFPSLQVLLAGDGPQLPSARQLVADLGLQGVVRFTGQVAEAWRVHRAVDVSVLCTHGEGSPNSIIEAMAAGRPVVATAVGGVPDVVLDDVTGILVAPGESDALRSAIARLLGDRALRERYGAAGLTLVRERHEPAAVTQAWLSLYGATVK